MLFIIPEKLDPKRGLCLNEDTHYIDIIDFYFELSESCLNEDTDKINFYNINDSIFMIVETDQYENDGKCYTIKKYNVVKEGNLFDIGYCTRSEYFKYIYECYEERINNESKDSIWNYLNDFNNKIIKLYSQIFPYSSTDLPKLLTIEKAKFGY